MRRIQNLPGTLQTCRCGERLCDPLRLAAALNSIFVRGRSDLLTGSKAARDLRGCSVREKTSIMGNTSASRKPELKLAGMGHVKSTRFSMNLLNVWDALNVCTDVERGVGRSFAAHCVLDTSSHLRQPHCFGVEPVMLPNPADTRAHDMAQMVQTVSHLTVVVQEEEFACDPQCAAGGVANLKHGFRRNVVPGANKSGPARLG
jgi:hypothetical protein